MRRTDKVGTEAALHKVAEYMTHVEDWYKQREMSEKVVRRVYVATDDPTVNNIFLILLIFHYWSRRKNKLENLIDHIYCKNLKKLINIWI